MKVEKQMLEMLVAPRSAVEALLYGAPDALRLYLYGLLNEQAEPAQICRELGMDQACLMHALDVLRNMGLYHTQGETGEIVYVLPEQTASQEAQQEIYRDVSFNNLLQSLFADRELRYEDYKIFYELMDVYGLPSQVLLMLAEYCISSGSAGNKISMSYIRKVGRSWAKEGIDSIAAAQHKIDAVQRNSHELRELLASLNILRRPTEQEFQLYEKWTNEWGFSFGAIRAAMTATTGAQYPTLKYLDGVLKNLAQQGRVSASDVQAYFALQEKLDDQLKEVLHALSYARLTVSAEQRTRYMQFVQMGFSQEAILLACAQAAGRNGAGLDYVERLLTDWHEKNLHTGTEIRAYLDGLRAKQAKVRRMLDAAGYKKRVSSGDMALYDKFSEEYGFADEVILFAAGCAIGASSPLRAMDTMLRRWHGAGVHNLEQAKAANAQFAARGKRANNYSDIDERRYTDDDLKNQIPDPTLQFMQQD